MRYSAFCLLTAFLASCGCGARPGDVRQPAAASGPGEGQPLEAAAEATSTGEAPRTPGGTIYGEVVAATDEIVEAIDAAEADPASAAPELHRAVQRFEAAARSWKIYAANTSDAEIALLQESRLAQHAAASDEKLRDRILRAARGPAADRLSIDLRHLLRVWRQSMSSAERAELERWTAENELPF